MSQIQSAPTGLVSLIDGRAVTVSTQVAEALGKEHRDVLRQIRNLTADLPQQHLRNFAQASIEVRQPNGGVATYPAYHLTRDGFTLLAMGFTGKRALQFKLAYIDAFNQMEAQLREPPAPAGLRTQPLPDKDGRLVRLNTELPADLHRRVKVLAALRGQTIGQVVETSLRVAVMFGDVRLPHDHRSN